MTDLEKFRSILKNSGFMFSEEEAEFSEKYGGVVYDRLPCICVSLENSTNFPENFNEYDYDGGSVYAYFTKKEGKLVRIDGYSDS